MKQSTGVVIFALVLLAAIGVCLATVDQAPAPRAKNVVFIVIDTLRADHLGVYGYERNTSPNIDRFAARGAVFDTAYSHSPWTMPSVASMFTAMPPSGHGIVNWRQPLSPKLLTLAEYLQESGFHTEAVVSHVIFRPKYHFDQGFDAYDYSVLAKGPSKYVSTAREVSDRAVAALDRMSEGEQPFFLWLHYFDPHNEYLPHEGFDFGDKDVDLYDSEIAFTDRQLGRVFDKLTELDRWDDTVVVLIADHGEEFRDHGGRHHTRTLYNEVIRIPLIVAVPGFVPQRIEPVVAESDVAPTLVQLIGLPIPQPFVGRIFPFERDRFRVARDRSVIAETLHKADKRGVRQGRWKWIHDREKGTFQLFDEVDDFGEHTNLIDAHPDVARRLAIEVFQHYGAGRRLADEEEMTEQLTEQLKALGYLQDSD